MSYGVDEDAARVVEITAVQSGGGSTGAKVSLAYVVNNVCQTHLVRLKFMMMEFMVVRSRKPLCLNAVH